MTTDTPITVPSKLLYSLITALGEAQVILCDIKADAGGDIDLDDLIQYSYEGCDEKIKYFADLRQQLRSIVYPSD